MGDEIRKSGHVAVYGIHFDTGKAAILPDSEPVLNEVVKLAAAEPGTKVKRGRPHRQPGERRGESVAF